MENITVWSSPTPSPSPRGEGSPHPPCIAPRSRPSKSTMDAPVESAVAKPHDITQSLLYLNGVSVTFDGFRAINNLSLELAPGEMRAIIGPNGAGKTTMMDIITGKTRPDSGDVLFDRGSIDLTTKDEAAIAQLGIGRKFQKPTVFENHTVEDNILLALSGDRMARGNLFWRPNGDVDRIGKYPQDRRPLRSRPAPRRVAVARPEAIARDRHADRAAPPSCCWWRSRGRHDGAESMTTADLLRDIAQSHSVVVVEHRHGIRAPARAR